ncbi:uncharacterized protein RB166_012238 [Leptodactylus fuscus]|uniref:uncharacterized protein LOC142210139 n=1 Tax=Leptodactylus fuscus TaxID=238119 RepID=UPI003F4EFE2A
MFSAWILCLLSALTPISYSLMCTKCRATDSVSCTGDSVTCKVNETCVSTYTEAVSSSGTVSSLLIRSCAPSTQCNVTGNATLPDGKIWAFTSCCNSDNCTSPIVKGYLLLCTTCRGTNSSTCTGESVKCKKDETCLSSYTETTYSNGTTSSELIRSCAPSTRCNINGSISAPTGRIWKFSSCCNSDNCTSPINTAPAFSSESSGVICPSCQASDTDWCYTGNTLPCTGDNNVCVLYTTMTDGRKSAVRGCASKSICGSQTYNINGSVITYDLNCTCGGSSSSSVCSDTNVTCAAGTACATVHTLTTMGDASSERVTKKCLPINQCGISGIASIPKGKMKIMTMCYTDSCNLPMPQFPEEKINYNGVTCRKCISADTDCYTSETMQCTGDERACLLQSTDLTGSTKASTAIRGCTTRNICDLSRQDYVADGITSSTKFACTNGAAPVQRSLAILATLFILKYLN